MQLTCGGILAVLVIREVLAFLKSRNGKGNGTAEKLVNDVAALRMDSRDLHEWHKPNPDGQQTWKNTEMLEAVRELSTVVGGLKSVVENNTQVSARLIPVLERLEAKS